ncbi:MAG: serine/threonine-protein kinase [bacterium]|nr:serine/threonine-protein kinase [bacterium]
MVRKIGNYTVIEEIGRGGMAVVFRAVQESLNRNVAIKELDLARFRTDPNALERFRLEARAAASLEHPNIVTIYDLWEEGEKAYIAMEFVDGAELRDVLGSLGRLEVVEASLVVIEVCDALSFAHSRGMIHRDVKPANVMLSGNGEVKLMDFGIVAVPDAGELTVAGQILGTPAYMAPEQITGNQLGPAADIFSLGAVFYEMLTGKKPFSGANHIALIQNVLHTDPPSPGEFAPHVPDAISQIVMKCLNKSPETRFSSMGELSTVLEMSLPLERIPRKTAVTRLVERHRDPESTASLSPDAGPEDVTAPFVAVQLPEAAVAPAPSTGVEKGAVHPLELDPPADLPPLEPVEDIVSVPHTHQKAGTADVPLSLRATPGGGSKGEEHAGHYVGDDKESRSSLKALWIVGLLILLVAGGWFLAGWMGERSALNDIMPVALRKAQLTIVSPSGGTVLLNGEELAISGGGAWQVRAFDINPGLYNLEVRHPDLGSRKYILELGSGERKEIEVEFDQR